MTESLAKVFTFFGYTHGGGRVPQAADAQQGVEQQARGGAHGPFALQLQQAVAQAGDIAQVAEEVAYAGAQRLGGDVDVALHCRQHDPLIETVVELVDAAVPALQRVVDLHGGVAGGDEGVGPGDEGQTLQRLGEAFIGAVAGLVGVSQAAAQEQGGQEQVLSHGKTPAWRRC